MGLIFARGREPWERKPNFSTKETENILRGTLSPTLLAQAKRGYAMEQTKIGDQLVDGRVGEGMERDYREAVKWYKLSAETGNPYAQVKLGHIYQYGGYWVERDYKEAIKWYTMVAEKNNPEVQVLIDRYYPPTYRKNSAAIIKIALNGLGEIQYVGGDKTGKCIEEVFETLKRNKSYVDLGDIYLEGKYGVKRDKEEAFKWYRLAMQNGDHRRNVVAGMVGFICPRCDNRMPVNTLSCNNCGGEIDERESTSSRISGIDPFSGNIHYELCSSGRYLACKKCNKTFNGWYCPKCKTEANMSNYWLFK